MSLADGRIAAGQVVLEEQLQLLLGMGRDPVTGEALGLAYPAYKTKEERIRKRTAALDRDLSVDERAAAVTQIELEEAARSRRRAVAGYDYTFSVPKSVSVLWAVADARTQARIAAAHHAAVADVIALMEREVAATRSGFSGPDGAVAQVEVTGLIATAFDHHDSRAGDPQLHTHVVVSNKVRALYDSKWRSLDGRPMHAAVVALSEHYNALLADRLSRDLGVVWESRERGRNRNPAWEIVGVEEELVDEFSSRTRDINAETDRLIAEYERSHGRRPSPEAVVKMRATATLSTRPEKRIQSLGELTDGWRSRASKVLHGNSTVWATDLLATEALQPMSADDVSLDLIAALGIKVVAAVGDKRSTWRRWNLYAEASRQSMEWRFATTEDREAIVGLIVDAAECASLRLTPPELAVSPLEFRRPDGSSVFRPRHSAVFTSPVLIAAEDRMLDLSRIQTGPRVDTAILHRAISRPDLAGRLLASDQVAAIAAVASSGRVLDVLVGPAGTGKTTAMSGLRRAWEAVHGTGSVVGLAPSATAADVLAGDLAITTENTA